MIKILDYDVVCESEIFARGTQATDVSQIVKEILDDVKNRGDEALKEYAKNASEEYKVKSIKEPKKDSKNKKIWTVTATLEEDGDEAQVKFVFYKGKVIDVIHKSSGSSLFEVMLKSYNSKDKE